VIEQVGVLPGLGREGEFPSHPFPAGGAESVSQAPIL
jgi:hypothetical protein